MTFVLEDPVFSEILCSPGSEMGRRHRAIFSQMPSVRLHCVLQCLGAARDDIRSSKKLVFFYSKVQGAA